MCILAKHHYLRVSSRGEILVPEVNCKLSVCLHCYSDSCKLSILLNFLEMLHLLPMYVAIYVDEIL